jgi:flagellar biosynthesis chaperone FliJ
MSTLDKMIENQKRILADRRAMVERAEEDVDNAEWHLESVQQMESEAAAELAKLERERDDQPK